MAQRLFFELRAHLGRNGAKLVLENGAAVLQGEKQDWRIRLFVAAHNSRLAAALEGQHWTTGYRVMRHGLHIVHVDNANSLAALKFINSYGYSSTSVDPHKASVENWRTALAVLLTPPQWADAIAAYATPKPDDWRVSLIAPDGSLEYFAVSELERAWNLCLHHGYEPSGI
jgi:hypothetical protein